MCSNKFLKQQQTACDKKTHISFKLQTTEERNRINEEIFMVQQKKYCEFSRPLNKSAQYLFIHQKRNIIQFVFKDIL